MIKPFNKEKLEQLLITNWTSFIDKAQLVAQILSALRDVELANKKVNALPERGLQLTISRLELTQSGLLIWIDFWIPRNQTISTGTAEFSISYEGEFTHNDTIGHTLVIEQTQSPFPDCR